MPMFISISLRTIASNSDGVTAIGSTPENFIKFVTEQSKFMNDLARKIDAAAK